MERYDFKTQRLFVEHSLSSGTVIELDRAQSNYLLNVLRLKEDAKVLVFNGKDGEWLTSLKPDGRKSCHLVIETQTRQQPQPSKLIYCFAPLKIGRLDYMIQKAVEMGAGVLQPVLTHHTQFTKLKPERIKTNAQEAAEQCGVLSLAECKEPLKLSKLIGSWPPNVPLIFADEAAKNENAIGRLTPLSREAPKGLLVGPEGGFSKEERNLLLAQDFVVPISLGPRILRADTAAVAAMAVLQAACGDW